MGKFVTAVFISGLLFGLSSLAWGQCQVGVFDTVTVEGIYAGAECNGNHCDTTFILDNDEELTVSLSQDDPEDQAKEWFGEVGSTVSVTYEKRLTDEGGGCNEYTAITGGKVLVARFDPTLKEKREEAARLEKEKLEKFLASMNQPQTQEAPQIQSDVCPVELRLEEVWDNPSARNVKVLNLTAVVDSVEITNVTVNRGNCTLDTERVAGCVNDPKYTEEDFALMRSLVPSLDSPQNGPPVKLDEYFGGRITGTVSTWHDVENKIYDLRFEDSQNCGGFKVVSIFPLTMKYGGNYRLPYYCDRALEVVVETNMGQWTFRP